MTDVLDAPVIDDPTPYDATERREIVVPFEFRAADAGSDGLTLAGYAAVFNSPTRIGDAKGEFSEVVAPGAFKRTINNSTPVLQFDHGQHPLIGSLPIGSISKITEDARGLYVEARVFDNWLTQPLRDAIDAQAVSGMSFRFSVVKDTWGRSADGTRSRVLNELRLYELGPVVFPAYSDTTVALRSLARQLPDLTALIGTSQEPASDGTSDEPAATVDPATGHSRTRNQRRAAVLLASIRKGQP
jgi:HK97 family phage prohead protease